MILPTKYITPDRALLTVGAEILKLLSRNSKTVSQLWFEFKRDRAAKETSSKIPYEWFVLSLDLLFALNIIDLSDGLIFVQQKSI